jgi:DNA polymerase III subunit delta'
MFFSDITGFKELKYTLTQSVQTNHLAHALLFRGQEGGAGIAIALAFANYILCADRTETEPCGVCSVCQKTKKYIHPDLHFVLPYKGLSEKDEDSGKAEMMAQWRAMLSENQWPTLHDWANAAGIESKQISISVKESRKILYNVALKPFEVERKVIFIWMPELLGNEAANALLKVLEEPNARTLFILIASDYDKILPTIISRTQLISIPRFSESEIAIELETKHQIESEKALQIARLADGNMNEAIKLTSDMPDNNLTHCRNWFRLCFGQKMIELVAFADEFQAMGKEPQKTLLQFTLAMLRETIIWNFGDENLVKLSADERDFISKFAPLIQPNKVEKISQWINESYYQLERNVSAKLVFLDLSIMVSKIIKS